MNSTTLHKIWSLIEDTQSSALLKLDDKALIQQLLLQLEQQKRLSSEETSAASAYLQTKVPLIRDLTQAQTL